MSLFTRASALVSIYFLSACSLSKFAPHEADVRDLPPPSFEENCKAIERQLAAVEKEIAGLNARLVAVTNQIGPAQEAVKAKERELVVRNRDLDLLKKKRDDVIKEKAQVLKDLDSHVAMKKRLETDKAKCDRELAKKELSPVQKPEQERTFGDGVTVEAEVSPTPAASACDGKETGTRYVKLVVDPKFPQSGSAVVLRKEPKLHADVAGVVYCGAAVEVVCNDDKPVITVDGEGYRYAKIKVTSGLVVGLKEGTARPSEGFLNQSVLTLSKPVCK